MAEITAANVGKLREMTGAGLMDCKKALVEANGEIEAAMDYLRKKGIASAEKKAGRAANEGVIAQYIQPGAKVGVLVEINCETDFVAKNESFRAFCDDIAKKLAVNPNVNLESDRVGSGAGRTAARHPPRPRFQSRSRWRTARCRRPRPGTSHPGTGISGNPPA